MVFTGLTPGRVQGNGRGTSRLPLKTFKVKSPAISPCLIMNKLVNLNPFKLHPLIQGDCFSRIPQGCRMIDLKEQIRESS
jgi:hypothetical protein